MSAGIISQAKRLIYNGYNVLPVYRKGNEDQPVQKFTDKETQERIIFTQQDAERWERQYTSGIALAITNGVNDVMTLDFDVTSKYIANGLRTAIKNKYPTMLIRTCNDPKFTIMFRGTGALLESSTGWSDWFDLNGEKQMIELSCNRKLTTIAGVHRRTGNPYSWGRGRTPLNTMAKDLVPLSDKDVSLILGIFSVQFQKRYPDATIIRKAKLIPLNNSTEPTPTGALGMASTAPTYTDQQLRRIISKEDGSDRVTWMTVGYALHKHYNGSEVGLTVWEMWSKQFDGYEEGQCEYQWGHMRVDGAVSLHTISKSQKREARDKQPTLEDYLQRYVFIKKGSLVADREMSTTESTVPLNDFRNYTMNETTLIEKKDGSTASVAISKLWMTDPTRVSVYSTMFLPGQPAVATPDERNLSAKYWNTYASPGWEVLANPNIHKLKYFTDHVEYLFGGEGHHCVDWFYTWAAQMIQTPQRRGTITLLHISTHTRTGRGWLSELLRRLVGVVNTSDTTISAMGNDSAKTGYMFNTILCTIAEVREAGKDRYSVSDSIKKKVTDEYQDVDVKYGAQSLMKIYTRFFMQSNHADPLIIDDNDGRFNIFANHNPPRDTSYYDTLYALQGDTEFYNSVYTFLSNYKVIPNKLTKVMKTKAREDVIMATKSPTASAYIVFSRIIDVYERSQLETFISRYHALHSGDPMFQTNMKELSHLEREYCRTQVTAYKKVGGTHVNVNVKSFKEISGGDVTAQLDITNKRIEDYFGEWKIKHEKEETTL